MNILMGSLINFGDMVLSTGAFRLVKEKYPEASLTALIKSHSYELFKNHPYVDDVIAVNYVPKKMNLGEMVRKIQTIRNKQFDLFISLDGKPRTLMLGKFGGIPERITPIWPNERVTMTKKFYSVKIEHTKPYISEDDHQYVLFQKYIHKITGTDQIFEPLIPAPSAANEEKADAIIRNLPNHEVLIGLCVKGTGMAKNWSKENFVELINRLSQSYNAAFYISGSKGDKEYVDDIANLTPAVNICGATSVMDLVALIKKSHLYITIDTGGMHLAATTKIPMVAIFSGPTDPKFVGPINENSTVLVKCSVDEALEAAKNKLGPR